MPPSCALLGGFVIGARVALLWQHSANAKCQRVLVLALCRVILVFIALCGAGAYRGAMKIALRSDLAVVCRVHDGEILRHNGRLSFIQRQLVERRTVVLYPRRWLSLTQLGVISTNSRLASYV